MTKKILVVDTDGWTGCNGCPCRFESGFHKQYCLATRKRLVWRDRIQDYCPLKELPTELRLDGDVITETFVKGYNACLKDIKGDWDG